MRASFSSVYLCLLLDLSSTPPSKFPAKHPACRVADRIRHSRPRDKPVTEMEPANRKPASSSPPNPPRRQNDSHAKNSRRPVSQWQSQPQDSSLLPACNSSQSGDPQIKSPESSPAVAPHELRQGAARGTRSSNSQEIVSAFEWAALEIQKKQSSEGASTAAGNSKPGPWPKVVVPVPKPPSEKMSRNRPRGPPMPRDNGLAANEETDMWNKILQDLRKAKEKNDQQKALAEQIAALNEKIGKEGGSKSYLFVCKLDCRIPSLFPTIRVREASLESMICCLRIVVNECIQNLLSMSIIS